jgi:CxxC-x17-CxxC domain-containing protein
LREGQALGSGKRARERRRAFIAALTSAGIGHNLAEHMHDNQVEPQLRAAELRTRGLDVTTAMVDTTPGAQGFEVACAGCGRTARLPFEPPPGKAVVCPRCQRDGIS